MLLDWVSYTFVFLEIVYLAHYSQSSLLTWKQFDLFWSCFENLFSKMRATFNRGLIWLPKWVKSLLRILTMHLELGGFQSSWWEQALFLVLGETSIGYPILVLLCQVFLFLVLGCPLTFKAPMSICLYAGGEPSTVLWGYLSLKLSSHGYFFLWL